MDNLKLIYDFSQRSPGYGVMLFPLLFVIMGIGIFLYHKNVVDKNAKFSFGISKRKFGMFFGLLFSSFTFLLSALTISSHISEYNKTIDVYKNKSYKTVQGLVENYHRMQKGGHDSERFTVQVSHLNTPTMILLIMGIIIRHQMEVQLRKVYLCV